ncbi:MAG: M14 family metallopeptidase [Rhodanobacteraceae bacterium]
MKCILRARLARAVGLALAGLLAGCAPSPTAETRATAVANATNQPAPQVYRDWSFPSDGVTFSNRLDGARLNAVSRIAQDQYRVTIAPESLPINPSPWYGFTVRSTHPRHLTIHFRYLHGKQRYTPKMSRDGKHWRIADKSEFSASDAGGSTLQVESEAQALRVFAQIPVSHEDYTRWHSGLARQVEINDMLIGKSVDGRPLKAFTFGNPDSHKLLVVIGRQHPPETTGARALMTFVDTLVADEPSARRFREQMFTLVIPLMNPDGVASGNWRGNAHGQDLNRDWGPFREPETRAARDSIDQLLSYNERSLALAIDFHSTWKDIFYIVKDDPSTAPGGVLQQLVEQMRKRFPGQIRVKANAATSSVFKNWVFRHYHAPAVTYEVGDRSVEGEVERHAEFAANTIMSHLMHNHAHDHQ